MLNNLEGPEKKTFAGTSISFIFFLIFLRLSGFSASTIVNLYNQIIKSVILTANTNTVAALLSVSKPFGLVLLSMIFFVLGLSFLAAYGSRNDGKNVGKLSGIVGAIFALIFFPSLVGIFLAASMFACSVYSTRFSGMYSKELKKWVSFRIGSNTTGKMLMFANVIIAIGLFVTVLSNQAAYEASFKQDLKDSLRSLALSLPGAAALPQDVLNQRIDSAAASITGSKFFSTYIIWLPVTTAFTAWIILEVLRNFILSNISGIFTYIMLKISGERRGR